MATISTNTTLDAATRTAAAIQEAKPVKKSLFKERFSSFKKVEQNEV